MKLLLTTLVIALLATSASAILDPDPDGIGIYFDENADIVCTETMIPFEQVTAYLLATNISAASGISGWEAYIWTTGAAPVAPSWTLAGGLDVDPTLEGFQVGIGTVAALPWAPAIVLATWSGFMMAPTDAMSFFVSGVPGSVSFPHSPGYAAGDNAGDLREFQVSSGTGLDLPAAMINSLICGVVANEDLTFSHVKSLYR